MSLSWASADWSLPPVQTNLRINLRCNGDMTQLSLELVSPSSCSSSSSSSSSGQWTAPPLARVDDNGRLLVLVEGTGSVTMFVVQVQGGGTSVNSQKCDRESFVSRYGSLQGFRALSFE
eukprot:CAMPEP_0173088644 /NCGR_PEP_ID=MMETSP1102-20130122/25138_1 /TAXON_ID=49646 /ORGANISM="Geminigera sp., Strain Caron Lab Isolate" /LENGTH=118 /DNA_ID=CAMNT_0013971749 /DNA_START=100 /DNA_END=456 /DNA_ORIENTATION=-